MGKVVRERLFHFNCGECGKWWAIGDASTTHKEWFCPWCGTRQKVKSQNNKLKS